RGPGISVGVRGVAVRVAADPARLRGREARPARGSVPQHDAVFTRPAGVEADLDAVVAPTRADLVRPQHHVPRARADRPGAVRRRGPLGVDGELQLFAPAPAAITG